MAIILIFLGIVILRDPVTYHGGYQVYIDYTDYQIPAGIAFILVGIIILVITFRYKYKDYICPKCEEVFNQMNVQGHKFCPKCNVALEELKGFYKHHPELKDNN